MAHFAQLNENNVVTNVIVVGDKDCLGKDGTESEQVGINFCQSIFGPDTRWVQTSINNRIRKNYAGIGFTYDAQRDAFIPPSPFSSWVLDEQTCLWEAPVPKPPDTETTVYVWDEELVQWAAIEAPPENV